MAPLATCACEEDRSKGDRQKPPERERAHFPTSQKLQREVNCQTARKQTDRKEDRYVEDIPWLGPRNALADIESISDNEDGENRGLGGY